MPAAIALGLAASLAIPSPAAHASARFTRFSVEDGLSENSVGHILQDRRGFLWLGTEEGLNRFDGSRFLVHRARDKAGFLADYNIDALVEDRKGDLWVGTDRGLHHLDLATGRFDRPGGDAAPKGGIRDVVEDAAGRIWFSAYAGGLYVLENGVARPVVTPEIGERALVPVLARGPGASIRAASEGRILEITKERSSAHVTVLLQDLGRVTALATDAGEGLWIGRASAELLRFDARTRRVETFPQVPKETLCLMPARDGSLWVGARAGGLSRLDPKTGAVLTYRHDPADDTSLSKDDVSAIYEDRAGAIWVGTWNGGVCLLDPYAQAFHTLRHRPWEPDSLPDPDVVSMLEGPDGRLWLGSRNGVLAAGDPRTGRFHPVAPELRGKGRITSLARSGSELVAGTQHGLVFVDPSSGAARTTRVIGSGSRLDERPISALGADPSGTLWAISQGRLYRVPPSRGELAPAPVELPLRGAATALLVTPAGAIRVGSDSGEIAAADRDGGPFRRVDHPGLREQGYVVTLYEDEASRLWIGLRSGLARLDPRSGDLRWFTRASGLPSTTIASVVGGADGFVWVATSRGLTRIEKDTGEMSHFGSREGALGTGYAENACARGAAGLLAFAGDAVTVFDPRDVRIDPAPPTIVLTGLEIDHRPVQPRWLDAESPLATLIDSTSEISLPASASVLAIEMSAVHFGDARSVRFSYRLRGFDTDWIETDAEHRIATYTRLAPGEYELAARARTKNGVKSAEEARLSVHVLPPWWRTRPALLAWFLAAVLAGAAAVAEVRRRVRVDVALMERETLRKASLTDALTGLYNRRFLASHLAHEVPATLRAEGGDLLFFLVDLDLFKTINDERGHAAGDRVLSTVAQAIKAAIRESDLAVRWGGDEFLVVSRSFERRSAPAAAERLRRTVEDLGLFCTLSVGWAAFPFLPEDPRALSWEQTLELADRALLVTKRRGRNRCAGFVARAGATREALLAYLGAGAEAPRPDGIELVEPEIRP